MDEEQVEFFQFGFEVILIFAASGFFYAILDVLDILHMSHLILLFGLYFGMILGIALIDWYSLRIEKRGYMNMNNKNAETTYVKRELFKTEECWFDYFRNDELRIISDEKPCYTLTRVRHCPKHQGGNPAIVACVMCEEGEVYRDEGFVLCSYYTQ